MCSFKRMNEDFSDCTSGLRTTFFTDGFKLRVSEIVLLYLGQY